MVVIHLYPESGRYIKRNQIKAEDLAQCLRTLTTLSGNQVWLPSISGGSERPVILVTGNLVPSDNYRHMVHINSHRHT